MAGPTSPGSEGPTFGPPQLPPGWIAQWDGASRKYYFVQLSTGVSQWDVPTDAAPTGSTPAPPAGDHPYGVPRQQELITHPDGSQTVRHADGSLEPVNPPMPQDGSRGLGDGPLGDRGLGSMAMNLLGGKHNGGGGGGGGGSNPLGTLAGQFLGGGSGHGNSGGGLGKIGGALASSFLSSSNKPEQPQNFHGGNQAAGQQQSHGLAGSIMGGVANMFGGGKPNQGGSNFGYSNAGGDGGYSGQAPPTSYQPSGHRPTTTGSSSYQQNQPSPQQSFPPPPGQAAPNHNPTYEQSGNHQSHPTFGQVPPPPAGGPPTSSYGQGPSYGAHPQQQNHHQSYGGNYDPSSYGGGPPGGFSGAYSNGPSQQHNQGAYGARY